ncbi:hypothetical protein CES86_0910 [Brucella lupini]|uniref:Uncharacterized protein n=1 Tax=Brucella lupini TaxID=255457 RepID=A0A256GW57_9HYPH|nr:hypothetical protein CES86_0910 [Brucella lupini]
MCWLSKALLKGHKLWLKHSKSLWNLANIEGQTYLGHNVGALAKQARKRFW